MQCFGDAWVKGCNSGYDRGAEGYYVGLPWVQYERVSLVARWPWDLSQFKFPIIVGLPSYIFSTEELAGLPYGWGIQKMVNICTLIGLPPKLEPNAGGSSYSRASCNYEGRAAPKLLPNLKKNMSC